METITVEQARALRHAVLHPPSGAELDAARALLDRWFEALREGRLAFAPGVQELLSGLRPARRH